jgi:hypothetical protein
LLDTDGRAGVAGGGVAEADAEADPAGFDDALAEGAGLALDALADADACAGAADFAADADADVAGLPAGAASPLTAALATIKKTKPKTVRFFIRRWPCDFLGPACRKRLTDPAPRNEGSS